MSLVPQGVIPHIVESDARGERSFDIYSYLLRNRIVYLGRRVLDESANLVVAQLLYLDQENPEKDISLHINSYGGSNYSGMAIYNTMQLVRPDVSTICVAMAASMANILLCAGAKGKRYALPNATMHMHQSGWGAQGQASDIAIASKHLLSLQANWRRILSRHTGQPYEKVVRDSDRDAWLSAEQAKEYGNIDAVIAIRFLQKVLRLRRRLASSNEGVSPGVRPR